MVLAMNLGCKWENNPLLLSDRRQKNKKQKTPKHTLLNT